MYRECEFCIRRKFCVKEEPQENESCDSYEEDEKLFDCYSNKEAKEETYESKVISDLVVKMHNAENVPELVGLYSAAEKELHSVFSYMYARLRFAEEAGNP